MIGLSLSDDDITVAGFLARNAKRRSRMCSAILGLVVDPISPCARPTVGNVRQAVPDSNGRRENVRSGRARKYLERPPLFEAVVRCFSRRDARAAHIAARAASSRLPSDAACSSPRCNTDCTQRLCLQFDQKPTRPTFKLQSNLSINQTRASRLKSANHVYRARVAHGVRVLAHGCTRARRIGRRLVP